MHTTLHIQFTYRGKIIQFCGTVAGSSEGLDNTPLNIEKASPMPLDVHMLSFHSCMPLVPTTFMNTKETSIKEWFKNMSCVECCTLWNGS